MMAARAESVDKEHEDEVDKMSSVITQLLGNDNTIQRKKRSSRERVEHDRGKGSRTRTRKLQAKDTTDIQVPVKTVRLTSSSAVSRCHLLPEPSTLMYEKRLKRLATKGVVQLFNGVNKQQKELEVKLSSAGSSEIKKQRILKSVDKRKFLDMLKGTEQPNMNSEKKKKMKNFDSLLPVEQPTWSVLRDNYTYKDAMKEETVK